MLVWINGPFGGGKTTTADALATDTGWPRFDPEHVGFVLQANLRDIEIDDFQDLSAWRALVPAMADELMAFRGSDTMIAVQSVLDESYWSEIRAGLTGRGRDVFHVWLTCDEDELRRRIEHDEDEADARAWRLDHVDAFTRARWACGAADLIVDTTGRSPEAIAATIAHAVRA
ncbi:MAG: AAA family ATPase [Actinomycetota bacterium]